MPVCELENRPILHHVHDVRDQLKRHVYVRSQEMFARGNAARDAVETKAALTRRKALIRETFLAALGGLPECHEPLHDKITGVKNEDGFRIEKVIFQSRPGVYVTGNLYLPDGLHGPRAAVQFLCGHSDQGKAYPGYQTVCRTLVRAGLIVFAQDPVGQGERWSYWEPTLKAPTVPPSTRDHDYAGSQCLPLGDALARYFVHDAMRGIDYLLTRPEVDPKRIGVTGSSGGGTQICMMMMVDPRIAAVAPGTFVTNRQAYQQVGGAQDAEQIWPGFTAADLDHEDFLLAMAPKPVCVLAVKSDFFPIEGTRQTVQRSRRFWNLFGRGDALELVEDVSTHAYTRPLARAAAAFFSKHLSGSVVNVQGQNVEPVAPESLNCSKTGQRRGELKGAKFVFEENRDRLRALAAARKSARESKRLSQARQWLSERVFHNRRSCELNPRFFYKTQVCHLTVEAAIWWSQEAVHNHGLLFRDMKFSNKDLPVTIAVWDKGTTCLQPHYGWIKQTCEKGRAVLVLDVTGMGAMLPHNLIESSPYEFYGVLHKLADDLFWLGDSLAALRVYDVTRAIDVVAQWPGLKENGIDIYTHGREGVYGQLASAVDRRIKSVKVAQGMGSYATWVGDRNYDPHNIRSVIIPGMLRYFDLPDIKKMCRSAQIVHV